MTQLTKCLSIKHEDQSSISGTFVKCWSCQYSPATPTIAPDRHRCIIDVHYPVRLAKSMIFFPVMNHVSKKMERDQERYLWTPHEYLHIFISTIIHLWTYLHKHISHIYKHMCHTHTHQKTPYTLWITHSKGKTRHI